MLRLAMVAALAPTYAGMVTGWTGPMTVEVLATGEKFEVAAGDDAALSELGLFLHWQTDKPGAFLSAGTFIIRQLPGGRPSP